MLVDGQPFELGSYETGTDSAGALTAWEFPGRKYIMPAKVDSGTPYSPKLRAGGRQIEAVVLRNVSGGALLPARVVAAKLTTAVTPPTGTNILYAIEEVDAQSAGVAELHCCIVDPWLDSAGVPDDALFWGIVGGPCQARLAAAGNWGVGGDIVVGDYLVATADGRIIQYDSGTDVPESIIAFALETKAEAGNESGLIWVNACARLF